MVSVLDSDIRVLLRPGPLYVAGPFELVYAASGRDIRLGKTY